MKSRKNLLQYRAVQLSKKSTSSIEYTTTKQIQVENRPAQSARCAGRRYNKGGGKERWSKWRRSNGGKGHKRRQMERAEQVGRVEHWKDARGPLVDGTTWYFSWPILGRMRFIKGLKSPIPPKLRFFLHNKNHQSVCQAQGEFWGILRITKNSIKILKIVI